MPELSRRRPSSKRRPAGVMWCGCPHPAAAKTLAWRYCCCSAQDVLRTTPSDAAGLVLLGDEKMHRWQLRLLANHDPTAEQKDVPGRSAKRASSSASSAPCPSASLLLRATWAQATDQICP